MKKRDFTPYRTVSLALNWVIFGCLVGGILLQPFIFWPTATIPYEIPRVWFVRGWILLLTLLTFLAQLVSGATSGKNVRPNASKQTLNQTVLVFLGLLLGSCLASSWLGANFVKSMVGNPYRLDGMVTLILLAGLALSTAVYLVSESAFDKSKKNLLSSLYKAISLSSAILSFWSLGNGLALHLLKMPLPNWQGAIGLSFGQPNFLGGYLLVTLPFYWWWYHQTTIEINRRIILSVAACQVLAIALTQSLGSLAGVVVLVGLLMAHAIWPKKKELLPLITALAIASFFITAVTWNWQRYNPESRTRIFEKVWLGYLERPILGWGVANVDYAFVTGSKDQGYQHDIYLDKAHSTFLEILTTTGIVGFVFYVCLLTALWFSLNRKSNQTLIFVLLIYLYHSQTNVTSVAEEVIFWLIVGISLSQASEKS
jgi:O-antigen ligase